MLKSITAAIFGVALYAAFTTAEAAELRTVSQHFDTAGLVARGQLKQCIFNAGKGVITLKDMMLVEDDAPGIGMPEGATERSWFEKLHSGIRIRKVLMLDDPRAYAAWLVFNGLEMKDNDWPLNISVNGVMVVRPPSKAATPLSRQYYTRDWGGDQFDNWFFVEIPPGALKKGANEIELWADSDDTSWEIMVADAKEFARGSETRTTHPDRSAKSRDGGKTWDFEHLGWKDVHDGEYCVRLSLDRSVPEGVYASPVIDMADTTQALAIKKRLSVRECAIGWDIDLPEGTGAAIQVRFGKSPVPDDSSWGAFESVKGASISRKNPAGRYMQFTVAMTAANPLATPAIKGLHVESVSDIGEEPSPVMCRLVSADNGEVVRSSVEYAYEDFGKLARLRETFGLDKVVAGAKTEFEAQLKLMRWAYEVPIGGLNYWSWDYYDLPQAKRSADGSIAMQKDYTGRRRDQHCLYCNLTLVSACLAMGYPARWVNIATRTTYGHEVVEVWSNDFNKWVFLDATRDYYIYDPDTGIPMSLTEINARLAEIMPRPPEWDVPVRWLIPSDSLAYNVRVAFREGDNKFSVKDIAQGPHLLFFKGQLHLPLRNDFASRHTPVPWRLTSNWGGSLFYGFYTDTFARKREYSLHTNRVQDFNPPLNQSALTLTETGRPGVIGVDIDTVTPCFAAFSVTMDNGAPIDITGHSFEWTLHEGLNTLSVRTKNSAGILGPASVVKVVMNR